MHTSQSVRERRDDAGRRQHIVGAARHCDGFGIGLHMGNAWRDQHEPRKSHGFQSARRRANVTGMTRLDEYEQR